MSAQTRYGYNPPIGLAGGIVDLAPYAIDTFTNEENSGVVKHGMGVIRGTHNNCFKLPATGTEANAFVGIVTNNLTTEYDLEGKVFIRKAASCGVMRYGRIFAKVAPDLTINAGDKLYLIVSGDNAGMFTNVSGENTVEVSGRFNITVTAPSITEVELFNAPAPSNS